MTPELKNIWKKAERGYGSALPMFCTACSKAELQHAGHAILDGKDDHLSFSSSRGC